jgi:hypothetical protein
MKSGLLAGKIQKTGMVLFFRRRTTFDYFMLIVNNSFAIRFFLV